MLQTLRDWFSAGCLIVFLTGCVGPVPKIDLAPMAMHSVKTVAVVRTPERAIYTVMNLGHPGMAFGLIGGAVVATEMDGKEKRLTQVYNNNHVAVCSELSNLVAERLNAAGFQAHVEDQPWKRVGEKDTLPFKEIKSDADAVVVLSPTILGFVATGLAGGYNNDYLPTMAVIVDVLGADREKPLYRGYHLTGWELPGQGWHYTKPNARYPSFDLIIDKPNESSAALKNAAVAIADSLMADLRAQKALPMVAAPVPVVRESSDPEPVRAIEPVMPQTAAILPQRPQPPQPLQPRLEAAPLSQPQDAYQIALADIRSKNNRLDPDSAYYNQDAFDWIMARQADYMKKGLVPADALRHAAGDMTR